MCGLYAIHLLLLWKPLERWVTFGEAFATSPAMAGLAAVTAAIIGARALGRQLEHAKAEALNARRKDAEASWWEKFEWVTDRILPKDKEKQEKLETSLALRLSTSLLEMSTAEFQREAVNGVIKHYLEKPKEQGIFSTGGDTADSATDPAAVRAFLAAAQGSSSQANRVFLSGFLYESEVKAALEAQSIQPLSRYDPIAAAVMTELKYEPDAVLDIEDRRVMLDIKGGERLPRMWARSIAGLSNRIRAITHGEVDLIVVTNATRIPVEVKDALRIVRWVPEDGHEALEVRIREKLGLDYGGDTNEPAPEV
ncbi:hypothetical protein [Arthrobacter sp. NA-172]|uniref:hypothetical protein n=1 Tax=Arthrobacter sp. NA-172 TaxID=3367524 RepID=UPI0037549CD1